VSAAPVKGTEDTPAGPSSGSTWTATLANAPALGDVLHLMTAGAQASQGISSITQTGVTWAQAKRAFAPGVNLQFVEIWIGVCTSTSASASMSITPLVNYTTASTFEVLKWQGIDTSLPFQSAYTNADSGASSSTYGAASTVTPPAGLACVILQAGCSGLNPSSGPTGGFTQVAGLTNARRGAYLIVASASGSYNTTWTMTSARSYATVTVALLAPLGATAPITCTPVAIVSAATAPVQADSAPGNALAIGAAASALTQGAAAPATAVGATVAATALVQAAGVLNAQAFAMSGGSLLVQAATTVVDAIGASSDAVVPAHGTSSPVASISAHGAASIPVSAEASAGSNAVLTSMGAVLISGEARGDATLRIGAVTAVLVVGDVAVFVGVAVLSDAILIVAVATSAIIGGEFVIATAPCRIAAALDVMTVSVAINAAIVSVAAARAGIDAAMLAAIVSIPADGAYVAHGSPYLTTVDL
jgi:hypothetical protein